MVYRRNTGRLGTAFQPTAQTYTFPASVGGVNSLDSLMMMPVQDCLYTYNLMPVEYGLRLRQGYREWANGCEESPASGANTDVRTVLNYEAQTQDPASDKLFAVTAEGIWDVTNFNTTAPVQEVDFTQTADPAGYGVKTEFTNDASEHFMFYADALNGVWQFDETNGWARPANWTYDPAGTGTVPFPVDNVAFVMIHKLRIWVILEDDDDAWYLPVSSIAGELKKFSFGSKLIHGGNLQGLWNWTIDGGDGVDDYLVAVSRGGDVVVYRGSDPEQPDWAQNGSWFIGETPRSRRLVAEHGSEMYLLSTYGLTSLRDLLQGTVANELRNSPSAKVNRFLRADVEAGKDSQQWALHLHPADGFMQIVTPEPTNTPYVQYNQNLSTKAWGFWEGVPMISAETWNGDYFIGGKDGVVWIYDGELDGTQLTGSLGQPISFRLLTSFQAPENHSTFKRVGFMRTMGILAGTATFNIDAVYDYKIETQLSAPVDPPVQGANLWDSAVWDSASWDFGSTARSFPTGVLGLGRSFAVAMRGSSNTRINVVGWDCAFTQGGPL